MTDGPTSSARDLALLEAIRGRDRQAFTALYQRYRPRLWAYLHRMLGDRHSVEEVLDDVMFVVWKDAARFAGRSSVSTWIFGIAYRQGLSAVRVAARRNQRIDAAADTDQVAAKSVNHDDLLPKALARLSEQHRQVIELTYYFGFSYSEIAVIADCPENTVKTRMFHARKNLQQLLPVLAGEKEDSDREQA